MNRSGIPNPSVSSPAKTRSPRRTRRSVDSCALIGLLGLVALLGGTAQGAAADKEACARSYEQAQRFRKANKLFAARQQLVLCEQSCPASLRADCVEWTADNDRRAPSLLIDAHAPDGSEITMVRVVMDDEVLTLHLDGKPITADPGEHVFRFEIDNAPAVVQSIALVEAEKAHPVAVRFERSPPPTASVPQRTVTAPPPASATSGSRRPVPRDDRAGPSPLFYAASGLGALGVFGFVYFGIERVNSVDALEHCKPFCTLSDVQVANRQLYLTGGSLLFALAGGGAAAYLYVRRPSATSRSASAPVAMPLLAVEPSLGGAKASLVVAY